ncbi:pyridoxal phosphate-dependent aminotransferase [Actinoallomurus spadix]|uniref:Aminotransferase class I/classII large domain-containing protein n=1 Tax=Actinoallomurus spadix TaxID=79912 RepID=A0ABN0VXV7_9ACTN|nr:pyridoxal phosphate-dependent aminotransferase [Actinoallomurus spadix]MCO5985987.1 pyridoxal phosphate-dependent aminotransferase [Actinoallomurus spadix]
MQRLTDIIADSGLPTPYDDATLLTEYQNAGHDPADVIYLSLGETWSEVAPGLRKTLSGGIPLHSHGYILSPYGLPALHRALRSYITDTHDLAGVADLGVDYEVAVSQSSTRTAMFHFGRLLAEENAASAEHRPIAITSSPGWDHAGVYTALGFDMRYFPLSPRSGYQPDAEEIEALLSQARKDTQGPVLLIINAQHNPSGVNWARETVHAMVRAALDTGSCLLIDDAFYGVHDPDVRPTNALRILLDEVRDLPLGRRPRWLAVRSLGKQFNSNGWGIGAMTGPVDTLTPLLTRLLPQHTYVSAVPLQAAMAEWLRDPSCNSYLAEQRALYAAKRKEITRRLTHEFGYPDEAFSAGNCTSYMLMRIPPWYHDSPDSETDYRTYCLWRTGVLLGEAHMTTPGRPLNDSNGYIRFYLGPPQETLTDALDRMKAAELTWKGTEATERLTSSTRIA